MAHLLVRNSNYFFHLESGICKTVFKGIFSAFLNSLWIWTANMSPSRFQMAFRQVYGTTAYEYLKVMRMNYALLQDSDDNIRTIAFKVGYRNAGHFSKLFRETFGMGPKEYRNIHKIK